MASHGEDAREDLLLGGGGGAGVSPSSRPVIRGAAPTELYQELVELYDEDAEDLRAAVDLACSGLVAASKVPEISGVDVNDEEIGGAGIVGGSPVTSADEDERELQASVKRKFVEAMEQLQSTHVPKKRRGNLPKEATDAFRDWFNEHYEHPYPTDEEKKQLALQTNVRTTASFCRSIFFLALNHEYSADDF